MTPPNWPALIEDYLALRHQRGFAVEQMGWYLRDFARYTERIEHHGPLTVDLAVRWAPSSGRDPAHAERRLSAIRQFARHHAVFDPGTEVAPMGLLAGPQRRQPPHIYSDAEISALLRECGRLLPRGGLRPLTYTVFFALLASTGLRLSEARHLQGRDVDLPHGVLTIRMSKFRKSRFVPLHPTSVQALTRYAARRDTFPVAPRSEFFFRTDQAPALRRSTIEGTFRRVRLRLGWTSHGRARRPRIHDLRHTFVVRRLLRWYEEGVDLDRKILALSTYLGHAQVSHTYWYLSAVPELLAIPAQCFERFGQRMPESGP